MGKGGKGSVFIQGYSSAAVAEVVTVGIADAAGVRDLAKFAIVRAGEVFVQDKAQAMRQSVGGLFLYE